MKKIFLLACRNFSKGGLLVSYILFLAALSLPKGTFSQNVGIGTTSPAFKLDVKDGSINTDSLYRIGGSKVLFVNLQNTFVGVSAANSITTGNFNTATGTEALYSNTNGQENTAFGYRALFLNLGSENTAIGAYAIKNNTTGSSNTANGIYSLFFNTTGGNNTANGIYSLFNNTKGTENTALGRFTLTSNTTGAGNTAVGVNANVSSGALNNATAIGGNASVNASNKVRIGNSSITVIEGQVAYSFPSDGRFKENVKDDVPGLDFILKLQPVSYNFNPLAFARHIKEKTDGREKELQKMSLVRTAGFIAQDVEKIIRLTGFTSFDAVHAPANETDNYSLGYAEFVVPLVKAVQEQQQLIEKQGKQIDELKKRLEAVEKKN